MGVLDSILARIQAGTTTPRVALPPATPPGPTPPTGPVPAEVANVQPELAPGSPTVDKAQHHMGILSAIGHVLAPEAGSFWSSALQNGLADARPGMAAYQTEQGDLATKHAADALKTQSDQVALAQAQEKLADDKRNVITTPDGVVGQVLPDGTFKVLRDRPKQSTDKERLIDQWNAMTDKNSLPAKLLERAILGQAAPDVITEKGKIAANTAEARAAATARHRAPRAGGSGSAKMPTGFILKGQ